MPLRPDNQQDSDYKSLLTKYQVLELEVRLLKAAFKMHTATACGQLRQQPSVFANACKNSDLFAPPVPCNPGPMPAVSEQQPEIKHESSSMDNIVSHWWKQPELHESTNQTNVNAAASIGKPDRVPKVQALGSKMDDLHDSLQFHHHTILPSRYRSRERETSVRTAQEMPPLSWYPAMQDSSDEVSKASRSAGERGLGEVGYFGMPSIRSEEFLAHDGDSRLSLDGLSAISSLSQHLGDREPYMPLSLAPTSEQGTLKSLLDLEPEAEIARFPTIFQLEKEGRHSTSGQTITSQESIRSDTPLTRAKTVTGSNPAARLLKPFDPAVEVLGVSTNQNTLPRRAGTERYRRRPYGEQFSGAGRTLWEEFERPAPAPPVTAPINLNRPELPITPRPLTPSRPELHIIPPQLMNPSVARSQSLNHHHHPLDHPQLHRLARMQSDLMLSQTRRAHEGATALDQVLHDPPPISRPIRIRRPATDPNHQAGYHQPSNHIESCIGTLREMGYKPDCRLRIYAEACNGMLTKAMEMAEEDEKATQEARKVAQAAAKLTTCVKQLQEMGYGDLHAEEELSRFATKAGGDVFAAVEALEVRDRREMEEWRDGRDRGTHRQRLRDGEAMPGSFP
jgi:hypothetical protein